MTPMPLRIVRGPHDLARATGPTAVAIGNFDGVHLGHRAVLEQLVAGAGSLLPTVVCFEPTPQEHFAASAAGRGRAPPARLSRLRDKVVQMQPLGVRQLVTLRFDAGLAAMSPDAFVRQVLVEGLDARQVLVGGDFRYGRGRAGDLASLQAAGRELGFEVVVATTLELGGARVSSTRVRAALAAGELDESAALLGRAYALCGRVRRGRALGRELGYPTANLALHRRAVPLGGIFAVRVRGADATPRDGVASLGTRPTVEGAGELLLEVHLFDFDGDLYGRQLEVEFVARLRDEQRFEDLGALKAQMAEDEAAARTLLGSKD